MSALPPKADIAARQLNVRFGLQADIGAEGLVSKPIPCSVSWRPRAKSELGVNYNLPVCLLGGGELG